jgi:hypothetical protein
MDKCRVKKSNRLHDIVSRIFFVMLLFVVTCSFSNVTYAITPGGLAYIHFYWPTSPVYENGQTGFYNFDVNLTIEEAPKKGSYYWAHQFKFKEPGDGGYMGLQLVNENKIAIFSIWNALEAEASPDGYKVEFSGEGEGWSVRIPFEWEKGITYTLRTWIIGSSNDPNKDEWWGAWIINQDTKEETYIGKIKVPGSWNWLDSWSVSWVEYFGTVKDCDSLPYAKVRFEYPYADDKTVEPTNMYTEIGDRCTKYTKITKIKHGCIMETGR